MLSIRRFLSSSSSRLRLNKLPENPILPQKVDKDPTSISQHFVDCKVTNIRAGRGGDGLVSFMHLKGNEFAGPDGGDGGNGGHVIFKGEPGLKSLNKIKSSYKAEDGKDGRSFHMKGKSGPHLIIQVPIGTIFKDEFKKDFLFEMNDENSMFIAARGGAGGKGNYYYLANDNKRPREFEPGHEGEQKTFSLELKLIADVALIGYPNVGKSSLLNALTNARAKIGDYSFTTIHPHVGVCEYEDYEQITVADLPGVLPDLSRGFGTRYFKHIEKCKLIAFVVDISADDHLKQYTDIASSIDFYDKSLLAEKKSIILANKVDQLKTLDVLDEFKQKVNVPVIPVSARQRINLTKLLKFVRNYIEK